MKVLVTGVSGYVGATIAPRLVAEGHTVVGFARDPRRVKVEVPVISGDAVTGAGLDEALDGVDVAYYLIHSMEASTDGPFGDRERAAADRFATAASAAGVRRIVYLGGPVPQEGRVSGHLASRLAVERTLMEAVSDSVALRASIVIGAHSRPFRFLVRLVERMPVLPFPPWQRNRSAPIDERDIVELLVKAAQNTAVGGKSLDIGGPEVISYGGLIARIRDLMLLDRPTLGLRRLSLTPIASRIAAAVAGEQAELIGPLMESLETDLLPRDDEAVRLMGVRRHSLDAAIEHALAVWERTEPLAAR
ncbi:MAG: NAD(P)H-binding protein [Actinomycetota bacterium]|nr:NAD(P)H-binding protein [Actinomycetota bacterium]